VRVDDERALKVSFSKKLPILLQSLVFLLTVGVFHSYVTSVKWSPDGTMLASSSGDRTVNVWDARTGKLKQSLIGHLDDVSSVAFSADGQWVMSGSSDKTIRLWDIHAVAQ
jgi:WD40 repeat protein